MGNQNHRILKLSCNISSDFIGIASETASQTATEPEAETKMTPKQSYPLSHGAYEQ